jgi:hypothetical protein
MATTGTRTPLAKEPKEDQAGVSATVGGSLPRTGETWELEWPRVTQPEGAQAAQERAHQERSKTQRAALLEQAEGGGRKGGGFDGQVNGNRDITTSR